MYDQPNVEVLFVRIMKNRLSFILFFSIPRI